ncbi:MAG: hypothetical protein JJT94_12170, partial [Bernardetiaceae bacterium]|nr:hypothetical protein [Bernardetiaceae bacterium]
NIQEIFEFGLFDNFGISYENPKGEPYNETRTDCDLVENLSNTFENLVIHEVIKPIIRVKQDGATRIVQRAKVVVKSEYDIEQESSKSQKKQVIGNISLPISNIDKEKHLKKFIQSQLKLSCSNIDAKKIVKQLSRKKHS